MYDVRGVADGQHASSDIGIGELPAQREGDALRQRAHIAQTRRERAGNRFGERHIVERDHTRRFGIGQGPDDRRDIRCVRPRRARQKRQWPGGQEALPCGVFVRAFGGDVSDHASLAVVFRFHTDAGEFAQR